MARTYPYLLPYRTCLGRLEDPCSFSSLYIEDLYSGQKVYVKHIQQIIDVLPKTMDPSSRFSLRAQVTPLGHQRMRDSLRTALWWLLPKDGDFRRASDGIHYYLARQGRSVVLRGGNVTSPLHESCLHWIHDPHPNQPPRVTPRQTVPRNNNNTVPRNNQNTVPRNNNIVQNSDALRGTTRTSRSQVLLLHAEMCVNQCPGVILKKIPKMSKCVTRLIALLNPLRKKGIENIEERGVREREKIEVNLLFMMRAGPISAQ